MALKKLIGMRIKELRNKCGLTQSELAEMVGIDPKHQSCVENGRNFPSADLLEKYAQAMNIDISILFNIHHIKERNVLIKEINDLISNASNEEIKIIHKIIFDLLM